MKMMNLFQKCLALLTVCASAHVVGQEACCDSRPFFSVDDVYLRAGYNSARGIGRIPGYGTVALYYDPMPECGSVAPYVDVRGHYLDNDRWAFNAGGGLQYATNDGQLFRGYAYYDWMEIRRDHHIDDNGSKHRHNQHVDQVAFGVERIGQEYDFRVNAYIPIHDRKKLHGLEFFYPGGYEAKQNNRINVLKGVELQASTPISICDWLCFYTTAGLYYFWPHHHRHHEIQRNPSKNSPGGLLRFETALYRGLVAGVQVAYDRRFQTCVSGEINWYFQFPGCNSNNCNDCFCMYPVRRQELIVTDHRCHWNLNY